MFVRNRHALAPLSYALFLLFFSSISCNRKDSPAPGADAKAVSAQVYDAAHPLEISVTSDGFVPAQAKVKVGEPVTLRVTRKVSNTCATDIVIKDYGINQPLPEGQRVELTITPKKPGPIRYACAMDMVAGELLAE